MTANQTTILNALKRLSSLSFTDSQIKENKVLASFTRVLSGEVVNVVISEDGRFSLEPVSVTSILH